jgi:hypothetical protein
MTVTLNLAWWVTSGDALQDGTTGACRERGGGDGAVRAAEQALYPGGHEVHWCGQYDAVCTLSLSLSFLVEGIFRETLFEGTNPLPEITSASCCGAEDDGERRGLVLSRSMLVLCHGLP